MQFQCLWHCTNMSPGFGLDLARLLFGAVLLWEMPSTQYTHISHQAVL